MDKINIRIWNKFQGHVDELTRHYDFPERFQVAALLTIAEVIDERLKYLDPRLLSSRTDIL